MENPHRTRLTAPAENTRPSPPNQSLQNSRNHRPFKNPTRLTRMLKVLLCLSIVISAVALWSGYCERNLLTKLDSGFYDSEETALADATSNNTRQGIVGLTQMVVSVSTLVFFLIWVHRANNNATSLGATGLEFTPGWAVGWYFVPILNLWKPYQAMKEIFKASKDPLDWRARKDRSLVAWWWLFWVVSAAWGKAAFRLSLRAEEMNELLTANAVMMISDLVDIPSAILTLLLVCTVYRMQMSNAGLWTTSGPQSDLDLLTARNAGAP